MFNCLISGSGRSGTSMMGGILHDAGYFMGDNLYPGRHSNPKGFFECQDINGINEQILIHHVCASQNGPHTIYAPGKGQFWLLALHEPLSVPCPDPEIVRQIERLVSRRPFAYKDPRFCYTLPVWRRYLPGDTKIIVMFRAPNVTINSILKECADMPYLGSLKIDSHLAQESWVALYRSMLQYYIQDPQNFAFIHYDQLLNGEVFGKLSDFLGVQLKTTFVDPKLNRSEYKMEINSEAKEIYSELCALAGISEAITNDGKT